MASCENLTNGISGNRCKLFKSIHPLKTKFKCLLNQLYAVGLGIYKTFLAVTQKFSLSLCVYIITYNYLSISIFQPKTIVITLHIGI